MRIQTSRDRNKWLVTGMIHFFFFFAEHHLGTVSGSIKLVVSNAFFKILFNRNSGMKKVKTNKRIMKDVTKLSLVWCLLSGLRLRLFFI